ncbi:sulfurtransferase TusA family protein [Parvularcula sp. IMCC14364]|uniref:sulfurtransferase TusA family protein n=1 Tax=Parvularcula sp. IMCC14364 TaxID=3067902 RepID=UPI002740F89B|nr:sulfurtransferase TusA family protein [Parvularcula sp. IMCC14364]
MADTPVLDTTGLRCPLPVIKTEAAMRRLSSGQQLEVIADDPLAAIDIPHFCREAGHDVQELKNENGKCVFLVTAGGKIGSSL